jgi:hypothetical protein
MASDWEAMAVVETERCEKVRTGTAGWVAN